MGPYIQVGTCGRIIIPKPNYLYYKLSIDDVRKSLERNIDLSKYHLVELDDQIQFILYDDAIANGQVAEFFQRQYGLVEDSDPKLKEIVKRLQSVKSLADLDQLAWDNGCYQFQSTKVYSEIYCTSARYDLLAVYQLFAFLYEGKIIMEGYNRFLKYIENQIKSNSTEEIASVVKVLIG